jgi:hypothetical protein
MSDSLRGHALARKKQISTRISRAYRQETPMADNGLMRAGVTLGQFPLNCSATFVLGFNSQHRNSALIIPLR